MGQKVNPIGFRLAVNRDWRHAGMRRAKDFADYLLADGKIREFLHKKAAGWLPCRASSSSAPGTACA